RSSPTCWIWEGVVMYLPHHVMHATLAGIAGRSAPGSTLIVNYHTLHRRFIARLIFRLIGEPQISAWTPEEMAADLGSVGFVVQADSAMADWNVRYAKGEAKTERGYYMRVAVARRSPDALRDDEQSPEEIANCRRWGRPSSSKPVSTPSRLRSRRSAAERAAWNC